MSVGGWRRHARTTARLSPSCRVVSRRRVRAPPGPAGEPTDDRHAPRPVVGEGDVCGQRGHRPLHRRHPLEGPPAQHPASRTSGLCARMHMCSAGSASSAGGAAGIVLRWVCDGTRVTRRKRGAQPVARAQSPRWARLAWRRGLRDRLERPYPLALVPCAHILHDCGTRAHARARSLCCLNGAVPLKGKPCAPAAAQRARVGVRFGLPLSFGVPREGVHHPSSSVLSK